MGPQGPEIKLAFIIGGDKTKMSKPGRENTQALREDKEKIRKLNIF